MIRLVLAMLAVAMPGLAEAATRHIRWPGPYDVTIAVVLDGDSVVVSPHGDCPFGCREGVDGRDVITIRIAGIDAPEIHACRGEVQPSCAACPDELELARQARAAIGELVRKAEAARIAALSPDKYSGRVVGDLHVLVGDTWLSIGEEMLRRNLAVPYDGGKKTKPWCGDAR